MEKDINDKDLTRVDIFFLVTWLWREKITIGLTTAFFAISSVFYALSLDNIYVANARLVADQQQSNSLTNLAQQLGGGLANFAGLGIGNVQDGNNVTTLALEILKSRMFFGAYLYEEVIVDMVAVEEWDKENNVLRLNENIYDSNQKVWLKGDLGDSFKPSVQSAFSKYIDSIEVVREGNFVTLTVSHMSPYVAKEWVELLIDSINSHMRQMDSNKSKQAIDYLLEQRRTTSLVNLDEIFSKLIEEQTKTMMLTNVKRDYIFEIIDPPVIAEFRAKPDRMMICILYTLLGGLFGVAFAIVKSRLTRIRD